MLKELKAKDEKAFKAIAHAIREDGAYVEAGENDNLIVQKLEANPTALGVFGFSFLDQNADKLQGSLVGERRAHLREHRERQVRHLALALLLREEVPHRPGAGPEGVHRRVHAATARPARTGYLADKGLIPLTESELEAVRASALALQSREARLGRRSAHRPRAVRLVPMTLARRGPILLLLTATAFWAGRRRALAARREHRAAPALAARLPRRLRRARVRAAGPRAAGRGAALARAGRGAGARRARLARLVARSSARGRRWKRRCGRCSRPAPSIAILATIGIVLSLVFEAARFFERVPIGDFLFGLQWSPQTAIRADQVGSSGAFGAVPVFAGTLLITAIAMAVAVPIGLLSAVYMSEYAGERARAMPEADARDPRRHSDRGLRLLRRALRRPVRSGRSASASDSTSPRRALWRRGS